VNVTWKDVEGSGGGLYDAGMWQDRLEMCAESCSQISGVFIKVGIFTDFGDIRRGEGYSQRSGVICRGGEYSQRSGLFVEVGDIHRFRGYS